ncbi:MAG TPA: hypothetical protein DCY07_00130 [Rhodospirillaceae bacterium]|nr:hypothetical protein [Rhodospirillaceae bacterium]
MVQSGNLTQSNIVLARLRGLGLVLLSRRDDSAYARSIRDLFSDAKTIVLNDETRSLGSHEGWHTYNCHFFTAYPANGRSKITIDYKMSKKDAVNSRYCEKLEIRFQRPDSVDRLVFNGLNCGDKMLVLADKEIIPQSLPWGATIAKEAASILKNNSVVVRVHLPSEPRSGWSLFVRLRNIVFQRGRLQTLA